MNPGIRKGKWIIEEDLWLLQKQKELGGNKWSKIAREWQEGRGGDQQARNELQIKNRFNCLIKKEESMLNMQ